MGRTHRAYCEETGRGHLDYEEGEVIGIYGFPQELRVSEI
jgi:hypothetical protein